MDYQTLLDHYPPIRHYTDEDVWETPESNAIRWELVDGRLYVSRVTTTIHAAAVSELFLDMAEVVERDGAGDLLIGPLNVRLSRFDVAAPDIVWIAPGRRRLFGELYFDGAPDLIVEVTAPQTRTRDVEIKRRQYARFGVREYWIVDPDERTIDVLGLTRGGEFEPIVAPPGVARSHLIDGLEVAVEPFFGDALWFLDGNPTEGATPRR